MPFHLRNRVWSHVALVPRQGWWASTLFLQPQRQQSLQSRTHPRRELRLAIGWPSAIQPVSKARSSLVKERGCRLGTIQILRPAADRRSIRQAIGILQLRRRLFPRAVFHKPPPQGLTTSQQAEVRVGQREQRKKSKRPAADRAATPPDPDPIVVLIVRLLAPPSVPHDRILFANRASA
jgi:hypothetical protein